ncbi:MAG: hypothetical protein J2P37_00205 [Ktedonobacteraceae bacterium]|nr:hypothetical protein [Ktedonobacteraceae bacterium]
MKREAAEKLLAEIMQDSRVKAELRRAQTPNEDQGFRVEVTLRHHLQLAVRSRREWREVQDAWKEL